ncbi:MAG: hypothetical protein HYU77_08795 [Betaproteobacteria bacterium]|nr:hypothetical protein [Betaproteobacteria bacterium]
MNQRHRSNSARRRWLEQLLAAAALGIVPLPAAIRQVLASGQVPGSRGIVRLEGRVTVNGVPAQPGTPVKAGDRVVTGPGSTAVFVIGRDAFLIREKSQLEIAGVELAVSALRMVTGKLLSVFGTGARGIQTATATIGIRGTGIYVESDADKSYVCTCYGTVDLQATGMPEVRETVVTRHHDAPRYIWGMGSGKLIKEMMEAAPVINHTDEELIMLEALVGRVPPFVGKEGEYGYGPPPGGR